MKAANKPGVLSHFTRLKFPHVVTASLLCLMWIVPGLIDHDPWKPDEAYTFGLVYHILQTWDWVVPTLVGEPLLEFPPLYYLTAAVFAKIFSPILELHNGARLASGFYMSVAFVFIGFSGRELYGKDKTWVAAICLLGSIGLLVRAHQIVTDISLLAGLSISIYGLALAPRRALLAGFWLGTGAGIAFMSKGLVPIAMILITVIVLPAAFPTWRSKKYLMGLAIAAVSAAPWLGIWTSALYMRSPELFNEWLWIHTIGNYFGTSRVDSTGESAHYFTILPWHAWPVLPLAAAVFWHGRLKILTRPGIQLPLVVFCVMLLVLSLAAEVRELNALPMLLPLSLLAAASTETLRRGAAAALDWFGIMTFGLMAVVLWLGWVALVTGHPASIATRLQNYQPGFVAAVNIPALTLSVVLTLLWIALISRIGRSNRRAIINWAGGITLIWVLTTMLWMPFLDVGKSYRSVAISLKNALPSQYKCVYGVALGRSQRAMFEYFGGITTRRIESGRTGRKCDLLIAQKNVESKRLLNDEWRLIWEGSRPGDKGERYALYKKKTSR